MTLVRLLLLAIGVRLLLRLSRGDRALLRRAGWGRGRRGRRGGRRGGREDRLCWLRVGVRRRSWRGCGRSCWMRQRRHRDGRGRWCRRGRRAWSRARGSSGGRPGALHRDERGHEGERTYERDDTSPPGQLHRCAAKQQAHRLLRTFMCRESHAREASRALPTAARTRRRVLIAAASPQFISAELRATSAERKR